MLNGVDSIKGLTVPFNLRSYKIQMMPMVLLHLGKDKEPHSLASRSATSSRHGLKLPT